jgi:hypothetical protein
MLQKTMRPSESMNQHLSNQSFILSSGSFGCNKYYPDDGAIEDNNTLGLVNKLPSILDCRQTSFGWLRLRPAVSAKLGLPTSRPAFCLVASLVLAGAKNET